MAAKKYLDLDGLAYFWGKITNYIGENHEILMGTTAGWNAQPTLISSKDTIYVYTDYDTDESGNDVPNIWLDFIAVQGTLRSLLQHHSS